MVTKLGFDAGKNSEHSSGIKLECSNTAQALELISQIFATDKGLEGLPDEEKLKGKQEKVKPLIDKYWLLLENM
ncbi:MAG: hypothetical protein LUC97_05205, partial [Clostridiales bacterium]|nr:hypothetical protein [Clostridiales bacterium]